MESYFCCLDRALHEVRCTSSLYLYFFSTRGLSVIKQVVHPQGLPVSGGVGETLETHVEFCSSPPCLQPRFKSIPIPGFRNCKVEDELHMCVHKLFCYLQQTGPQRARVLIDTDSPNSPCSL